MASQALKPTTSAAARVSFNNPKASMDTPLPAVFISNEVGCLSPMPVSKNPRRSVDFLYNLLTGQKEGEECVRSSDIEVLRNPRRPSQGPAEEPAIVPSSKSIDFSQFQRAMLLSSAKMAARTSSHTEQKKMLPKLGKHLRISSIIRAQMAVVLSLHKYQCMAQQAFPRSQQKKPLAGRVLIRIWPSHKLPMDWRAWSHIRI